MTLMIIILLVAIGIGVLLYYKTAGKKTVEGPRHDTPAKPLTIPETGPKPTHITSEKGSIPDRSDNNNPDSGSAMSAGGQG